MKAFSRLFEYIWPQWPRVVVVVLSAFLVSVLLSLSFMTVVPLLKVMMGQEGLHGWVDRKICQHRFGLKFDLPEATDFTLNGLQDIRYYLRVIHVEHDSPAARVDIKTDDRIIGAGDTSLNSPDDKIPYPRLLQTLADPNCGTLTVQLRRFGPAAEKFQDLSVSLACDKKAYLKDRLISLIQKSVAFLPREQSQQAKTKSVIFIIIAIGIVTIFRCVAKFYQNYLAEKVVQVGINRLRTDAFAHVMDMPMGYFANQRPSDVVSRLVRDTGAMGAGVKILLGKALREPLNAVFLLAAAALLNWQLTVIFFCGAPPTIAAVSILGRKMKQASKKSLIAWSQMLACLQETMAGLKIIKVYNQQTNERDRFETINKRLLKQLLRISKIDAATMPLLEILGMAAGSAALITGASWVTYNKIEGPQFLVLLILLGSAAEAVRKTSDIWNKIQEANAAAERVFAVMDEPQELETAGALELPPLKNKIEFKNVVFTYPGCSAPVLKGIDLTVQAGHNIAIVGPNGSGKTTLANLLPRFYDPDSGTILIDGIDIRDVTLASLRSQIGLVTQNIITFNESVAANIAYAKPNATMDEIITAAKRAHAHEFIELLPYAYATVIGEHATGLSGGQLQRLAVARAILKNPSILIFDEATSQVDADSESKIRIAIEEILHDRTCFIIAHRFSTVVTADLIVVTDDGKIIAQGKHADLIRSCRLYQTLYETQLIKA